MGCDFPLSDEAKAFIKTAEILAEPYREDIDRLTRERDEARAEVDRQTPTAASPALPMTANGFPAGPMLYPKLLRNVADLITALTAFEKDDPDRQESPHFVAHASLAIYNEEEHDDSDPDEDPMRGLAGWVTQIDTACWVFVPHDKHAPSPPVPPECAQ